jgi:hypothetical protein
MDRPKDVDADLGRLAVEVEVGEDDPAAASRVIGAQRVVREDVHACSGRGRCGVGGGIGSRLG